MWLGDYGWLHVFGYLAFALVGVLLCSRGRDVVHVVVLSVVLAISDTVLAHVLWSVLAHGWEAVWFARTWSIDGTYWGSPLIFAILAAIYTLVFRVRSVTVATLCIAWLIAFCIFKLACFARGCCGGRIIDGFLAEWFGQTHPTQIYESTASIFLAVILIWLQASPTWRGRIHWLLGTGFGSVVFFIEFTRESARFHWGPLSLSQCIAGGVAVACWLVIAADLRYNRKSTSKGAARR